jgi:hypothetical protein
VYSPIRNVFYGSEAEVGKNQAQRKVEEKPKVLKLGLGDQKPKEESENKPKPVVLQIHNTIQTKV